MEWLAVRILAVKSSLYVVRETVNYWMRVERYPNLNEEVDGSIPGCEISSALDKKPR